jgi:hypothetical protein
VVKCGRFEDYDDLANALENYSHPTECNKKLSPEFLHNLENLPNSEVFKKVQSAVKELKYRAVINVSYI